LHSVPLNVSRTRHVKTLRGVLVLSRAPIIRGAAWAWYFWSTWHNSMRRRANDIIYDPANGNYSTPWDAPAVGDVYMRDGLIAGV
jgi:hypothetical protein